MAARNTQGMLLLSTELAKLMKEGAEGFSAGLVNDDPFKWEVAVYGPPDTFYEGGVFKATLTFPKEYPNRPPKMKFMSKMWHPNIAKDGAVCISILHDPGNQTTFVCFWFIINGNCWLHPFRSTNPN